MDVRPAEEAEIDYLAKLWYDGWQDAHARILPAELARLRTLESFRDRFRAALPSVRVVGPAGQPVGFCMVKDDELYQLYVSAHARGSGVAAALVADAEARLAARGVETAWLACAIGNQRAAKFYEKSGWRCAGTMINQLETPDGPFPLEVWRYEKDLRRTAGETMPKDLYAETVMERCAVLGQYSEEPGRLTRRFATEALRQANEAVAGWMRAAGMAVRQDSIGNLVGRYEAERPGAKTLLLGSHLDSVRDAGKYDGPLGVLVALACVARLHDRGRRLPFAIEVLGFADEEGVRYHTAYLGSQVVAGTFDPAYLDLVDADGVPMAEAIRAFGGDPAQLQPEKRRAEDLLGYCEVHIEQGPVLEAHDLPVGVVTAIAGQSRFDVGFTGVAGHAGTVPMQLRHDALCAAAEFILAVEAIARAEPGLVATVGQLDAQPGASNVIPGAAWLSLDVRHQDDAVRERAYRRLQQQAAETGAARGVELDWRLLQEHRAVPCAPTLAALLARAIEALGYPALSLPSGAGHDGVVLSTLAPIAMLFVRCKGGVSHNPAESVAVEDVAVAIETLSRFLELVVES